MPELSPGSYVVLEDQRHNDSDGQKAKLRIEVEGVGCNPPGDDVKALLPVPFPTDAVALRYTKNSTNTYWGVDSSSSIRFCLRRQGSNIVSPIQYNYDTKWGSPFTPLAAVYSNNLSYSKYNDLYLGKLGPRSRNSDINNANFQDEHDLFYGLVPAPGSFAFNPGGGWTNWIDLVSEPRADNKNLWSDWHSEIKAPERGGKILVRSVEEGFASQNVRTTETMRWMVTEDWEWGRSLPIYIKQYDRSFGAADKNAVNRTIGCWKNTPYSCTDTTLSPDINYTVEMIKAYEYFPDQKLKADFVKDDGMLTKQLAIPATSNFKIRILTENDEPYFGFVQIKVGNGTPAVWNTDNYPIFVAGQDLVVKGAAWANGISNGAAINFKLRAQVSNEQIDVSKPLNTALQPNVDSIPWSDTLTLARNDGAPAQNTMSASGITANSKSNPKTCQGVKTWNEIGLWLKQQGYTGALNKDAAELNTYNSLACPNGSNAVTGIINSVTGAVSGILGSLGL